MDYRVGYGNRGFSYTGCSTSRLITAILSSCCNTIQTYYGDQWGMTPGEQDQLKQDIDSLIKEAKAWVKDWIPQGRDKVMARALLKASMVSDKVPADYLRVQPSLTLTPITAK
jgi:hypothetical protein